MNTNLVKLDKELALSQQDNTGAEIMKQVGSVMGALKKFEEETEAKAIKNAENLEVDAIGVDLLPEAGKDFMYNEFNRIGEELAKAENRKDRKAVRELKLEGATLIKAQNTIGQMLKDHAEDLLGIDGEGNYSGGSDKTMMNMLINKEYTLRKDGKDMVIDFNGPNGKKGIKLEDLDEHIYLKKKDLAVNYDNQIKTIRNSAYKGLPFEKDELSRVVKQTLNTTQKLVASMWDDNFTLKDGKTLKDLWQEENPGLDADQYLRTSGSNWDENAIRDFANKKLMQGGINDDANYRKKKSDEEGGKGKKPWLEWGAAYDAQYVPTGGTTDQSPVNVTWRTKRDRRSDLDNLNTVRGSHYVYTWDAENEVYTSGDKTFTRYEVADIEGLIKDGESRTTFNVANAQQNKENNQNKNKGLAPLTLLEKDGDDNVSGKLNNLFNMSVANKNESEYFFAPFSKDYTRGLYKKSTSDNAATNDVMLMKTRDKNGNLLPENSFKPVINPATGKPYRFKTGSEANNDDLKILNDLMVELELVAKQPMFNVDEDIQD